MAPILTRTPLAAISFADGSGDHIRVYYQDAEGHIRETFYDSGKGWHRRDKDIIGKGKLNTGIAATTWDNGTQIRVYFLSEESHLVERCYTGGAAGSWFDGALTHARIAAAPYSMIGAIPFALADYDARVYYQNTENKVCEAALKPESESWTHGPVEALPTAVPGTSISAVSSKNRPGQRVWVYFQKADMRPVEYQQLADKKWQLGGYEPTGTFAPGAYISAVHFGDYNIAVFAVDDQNVLVKTGWVKNGLWQGTKRVSGVITHAPVAAISVPSVPDWIRAYTQAGGQTISEQGSNDGGNSFVLMNSAIPVDH